MEENLNLKINKTLLKSAFRYAEQKNIDLSVVIEDFLVRFIDGAKRKEDNNDALSVSGDDSRNMPDETTCMVKEEQTSYQMTKIVSQEELDAECITLEESKRKILKKIHDHFHHS